MKIKHLKLDIPANDPFVNCKLNRKNYAQVLTQIIKTYADGFVLAITGEWGTGKTTFIEMWQKQLKNDGFKTIYFNAWENDFDGSPLIALMAELKGITNQKNKAIFNSIIEKGAVLVKRMVPALTKSLLKKYAVDVDEIVLTAAENATEGITEILEHEIQQYANKKNTILDFRKQLEKFVMEGMDGKPLIFIIDELDRCRPSYAVEVLEQMKHFFNVSGIVFVLSIDKYHLASSIKGVYGSENINTDEYLRRFIDLEYSLPLPTYREYCEYLYNYFSFSAYFINAKNNGTYDNHTLLKTAELLFEKGKTTLRQQEKVFGLTRLVLNSFTPNYNMYPCTLMILVYLKIIRNDLYRTIENNDMDISQLSSAVEELFYTSRRNKYNLNLTYVQAQILQFYNNNQDLRNRQPLFTELEDGTIKSNIISKFDAHENVKLVTCLKEVSMDRYVSDRFNLKSLMEKINLLEPIEIS